MSKRKGVIFVSEDLKRDKTKAFKASAETIEKIESLIKKSGKGPTEFFEDLVSDLSIQSVVDKDNGEISPDLRKHFESDVQKLKNATNAIISTFVSQMENISVEKNQWQVLTEKQLKEKQDAYEKLSAELNELKSQLDEGKLQFTELTKVNNNLTKELDTLTKRTQDQEQIIQDRTEKAIDLQERINKLNENIVDKDEQLKSIEPIKQELSKLKETVQHLNQEKEQLIQKHKDELNRTKENLLFESEKAKHKLEMQLTEQFTKEKEALRNEVRKETEQNIREFYLAEIERKEAAFKAREEEFEAGEAEFKATEDEFKVKESEFKAKEEEFNRKFKANEQLQQVLNPIVGKNNTRGKGKQKQD